MFLLITTNTKTIYKLPLTQVTYPEKNLVFYWKMKKEEKAKKKQKEVQNKMLLQEEKEAQRLKDTEKSRGQHSENVPIAGITEIYTTTL